MKHAVARVTRQTPDDRGPRIAAAERDLSARTAAGTAARSRLDSIDLLRGCVMILMALDHVRDYFGNAAIDPTDPATTTAALFFTRWITHFCAPVFFLLTGVGAYLAGRRRTTPGLSRFLLTRGLWFLVLELFVMRCFGWQFNVDYRVTLLTVLWAIGWGLIALAGLVYLPASAVGAIGVLMIAVHNLFDRVPAAAFGRAAPLWSILHAPGVVYSDGRHLVFAAYTLIPWIGVVAAGYGLGRVFEWDRDRRRRTLAVLGTTMTAAFLALRAVNVYGDPRPWRHFPIEGHTALSFLNATKYPPSLLFLLMTLGPPLLFLRAVDGRTLGILRPALVFGRVPLFYYMLHVVVMHVMAVAVCQWRYGAVHWMFESPGLAQFPVTQPPGWPLSLPYVYLCWAAVVVMLYPLCRWFAGVRRRRTDWWLSYL